MEIQKHFEFPLVQTKCIVESKIDLDGREVFFTNDYVVGEKDKKKSEIVLEI